MPRELKIFFTAIMFYTRFPVPKSTGYSAENLNKATKYFPLMGIIIGSLGAVVFYFSSIILPVNVAIIASLSLMVLATGAFHEDAIADFCDGFGGGYGKEQILKIMKDSHIGTYGTVGLIVLFLSKFILLSEMEVSLIPLIIIAAHAISRLNSVVLIFSSNYVRDEYGSKAKPVGEKHRIADLLIAIVFGTLPLLLLPLYVLPVIIVILLITLIYFRFYIHKKIGGYTGDVLGALQQISEVGVYLSFFLAESIYAIVFS